MEQEKRKPNILFSSPWGNYPKLPIEKDPIDFFYYRNTLKQGPFQLRIFQSWHSLHFLAQNLPVNATVLENPTPISFKSEIRRGNYQIVAISFNFLLSENVLEMAQWLKSEFKHIKIIIGGYGTALFKEIFPLGDKLKKTIDCICYGEGIEFFKNYFLENWNVECNSSSITQSLLPNVQSFFRTRIPIFKQMVFIKGLGCAAGCNFCATSYHFKKKVISLFNPNQLFNEIKREALKYPRIKSAVIYDEDFLANPDNIIALINGFKENEDLRKRPLHFTVFTSIHSLQNYSSKELLEAGIGTLYIGVESLQEEVIQNEKMWKREGNISNIFEELHRNGINTLGSLIVGWDNQTIKDAENDADAFVRLNPTFYQIVPLHPVPGTPMWKRVKKESRIMQNYKIDNDGVGQFIFELKNMSNKNALRLISKTYKKLVDEGGPWPFRLAENQLNGYLNLKTKTDQIYLERAESYRKMLLQILPLAVSSRFLFRGESFKARWANFINIVKKTFPLRYYISLVLSPLILGLLVVIVGFGSLIYFFNPKGGQPNQIKMVYPQM
jgi:haloalkane dehalogenase